MAGAGTTRLLSMAEDTPGRDHEASAASAGRGRQQARGYGATLVVGLVAATALIVAVSRPWVEATARQPGLPTIEASARGNDVVPLAGALAVVVLAAFGAVIATRGVIRRFVGLLIVVASVVIVVAAVHPDAAGTQLEAELSAKGWSGGAYATVDRAWRWLALSGALLCAVAGWLVGWLGARWATMGSRYDAPGVAAETRGAEVLVTPADLREADVWREIDEGRDPTQTP